MPAVHEASLPALLRRLAAPVAIAALVVLGAGCGDDGDGPGVAVQTEPPATTSAPAVSSADSADTAVPATDLPATDVPATDLPATDVILPSGFRAVLATVTGPDGEERELCLLLAATADERARGLMGVTALGAYDGMVFVWDEPSAGAFWMKDTLIPLSIAFFDAAGGFVSATDMVPCPPDTACPTYGAAGEYTAAVEVPAGGLAERGLVDGATLNVSDETCTGTLGDGRRDLR